MKRGENKIMVLKQMYICGEARLHQSPELVQGNEQRTRTIGNNVYTQ